MPFECFGPLKDVYLPKDYYTGESHGFGFVQFIDPQDAAEAQYHMDGQYIGGRDIGTIGHVAHGKSTVVKAITGVQTVRFKNELERNITIKLGYANAKIYKCEDERCPRLMSYKAYGSGKEDSPLCDFAGFENTRMKLLRHVSFVDCPVSVFH